MPDTSELRTKTRRVKNHILDRFLKLADKVDRGEVLMLEAEANLYNELLLVFAKNSLPRSTEITGEDGADVKVAITGINYIVPSITELPLKKLDTISSRGNHFSTNGNLTLNGTPTDGN